MKKFLKAMLAAMLIAITAVTVCSCGVPSDPAKAKKNLKDNKYYAYAYNPENPSAADDFISTTYKSMMSLWGVELKGKCTSFVMGTDVRLTDKIMGAPTNYIYIYYFDNFDDPKTIYNKVKAQDSENKDKSKDTVYKASGKVFYMGTKAAVKAAG